MQRREFIELLGKGALGTTLAAMVGCLPDSGRDHTVADEESAREKMSRRIHPKSGDQVSLLGYGAMRLPKNGEAIDQEAVNYSVDYALAHGVNFFDTSPRYCQGASEAALGQALSRHSRESYFISTKMSNQQARSRADSLAIWENSLKNLQTSYFDYYLLHALGDRQTYKERYLDNGIVDFLLEQRRLGKIRHLGWSFHGQKEFFDFMLDEAGVDWDFVMIQLNYFDWDRVAKKSLSTCSASYQYQRLAAKNIPVIVMEPLLGGRLARPGFKAQEIFKKADTAASYASWAMRFAGSRPGVLTVLSGMTYLEDLKDNLRSFSPLVPLTAAEEKMVAAVADLLGDSKNIPCTQCQYCMPCPFGVDIPTIFNHYNRSLNEDNFPAGQGEAEYKRARKAYLSGLLRRVERPRQADHCIGCGYCEKHCPQNIPIVEELAKIDQYIEQLKREGGGPC